MAVETIKIIDFGKALEFFESAFNCLDQKEVDATSVKIIRLSVQRLAFTCDQIKETCFGLLTQIQALEEQQVASETSFQAPERRDTEEDIDDTEALASGVNEEIEPYRQAYRDLKEKADTQARFNAWEKKALAEEGYIPEEKKS